MIQNIKRAAAVGIITLAVALTGFEYGSAATDSSITEGTSHSLTSAVAKGTGRLAVEAGEQIHAAQDRVEGNLQKALTVARYPIVLFEHPAPLMPTRG